MKIKIKRLHPDAKLPTRATDGSAAYDLYACHPREENSLAVPTGIAVEIPSGYVGLICPRSGLARSKVTIQNSPGIIDSDYRGEICVMLRCQYPHTHETLIVKGWYHQRIAQLLVVPCMDVEWEEVDELSETKRGTGGFGSTGS